MSSYDQTQPQLTPDFLNQYDVIILQWIIAERPEEPGRGAPWAFSAEEVTNLQNWVQCGRGHHLADRLSGYDREPDLR